MTAVIGSDKLNWRCHADGYSLHLERRAAALLHVVPDAAYPQMWRVKLPDGSLSDMVNLTRAKDAGRHQALAALNRKTEPQETGTGMHTEASPQPDA